jgi:CcmD family protein
MTRRVIAAVATMCVLALTTGARVFAQTPQREFVPVQPGAMQEAIPAAPLVFIAYGFVWVALAVYIVVLWRRVVKVERELGDLNRRVASAKRS